MTTNTKKYDGMNDTEILVRAAKILEQRAKYNTSRDTFSSPDSVRRYLSHHMEAMSDGAEHFIVLYLDTRHRLIASETPFHGTIDSAAVYPREIAKTALSHNAAAVVFAHNHPSGSATPSRTDIRLTEKLAAGLALFDIRVLDHLVYGNGTGECISMAESGQIT